MVHRRVQTGISQNQSSSGKRPPSPIIPSMAAGWRWCAACLLLLRRDKADRESTAKIFITIRAARMGWWGEGRVVLLGNEVRALSGKGDVERRKGMMVRLGLLG